jgi:hypothetical protein
MKDVDQKANLKNDTLVIKHTIKSLVMFKNNFKIKMLEIWKVFLWTKISTCHKDKIYQIKNKQKSLILLILINMYS